MLFDLELFYLHFKIIVEHTFAVGNIFGGKGNCLATLFYQSQKTFVQYSTILIKIGM